MSRQKGGRTYSTGVLCPARPTMVCRRTAGGGEGSAAGGGRSWGGGTAAAGRGRAGQLLWRAPAGAAGTRCVWKRGL